MLNRLVAATLENQWNEALTELDRLRKEYEHQQENAALNTQEQETVRRLAHDLPALWNAPTTEARDRKRILRLLVKDITVECLQDQTRAILHMRWQGGACEDIVIPLKHPLGHKLRYPAALVQRVRQMAGSMYDGQIAAELNREGTPGAAGTPFTSEMIRNVRHARYVPQPPFRRSDELTVKEMCDKFGVSIFVVRYWIQRGVVSARRESAGSAWLITMNAEKEGELKRWVAESPQINRCKRGTDLKPSR